MKKLFILATAAVAFASCSDSDLVGNIASSQSTEQPQAVQFGTYMGTAATRAAAYTGGTITTAGLQNSTQGFAVIAYYTGATDCYTSTTWSTKTPNFMYNQPVTYETTAPAHWTYSPVKFWPNEFDARYDNVDASQGTNEGTNATNDAALANGGKVSFFAYAPYSVISDYTSTAIKNFTEKGNGFDAAGVADGEDKKKGVVAITANTYNGEPEVKYVLGKSASNENGKAVDLLWGMRAKGSSYTLADGTSSDKATADIYNTDLTKQSVDETVDFYFKHALAKIGGHVAEDGTTPAQTGLRIILDLDNGSTTTGVTPGTAITGGEKQANTLVTVNSITIQDLATYNDANSGHERTGDGNLLNVGWFNIAKGTWNNAKYDDALETSKFTTTVGGTGSVGTLNANIAEQTVSSSNKLTYTVANGWKFNTTGLEGVKTDAQDVYSSDSDAPAILLIPSTDNNQTFVVTITYTVRTFDDHLASVENETTNTKVVQTITNQVTIPKNSLSPNKYYKLLIHLGLTSVKFSAEVADWTAKDTNNNGIEDTGEAEGEEVIWLPSNTLATTVSANGTTTATVTYAATPYTIQLTGATIGNKFIAEVTGDGAPTITPANGDISATTQEFTVVLPKNTTNATKDYTVTIKEWTDSDENGSYDSGEETSTTTVTITKQAAPGEE